MRSVPNPSHRHDPHAAVCPDAQTHGLADVMSLSAPPATDTDEENRPLHPTTTTRHVAVHADEDDDVSRAVCK